MNILTNIGKSPCVSLLTRATPPRRKSDGRATALSRMPGAILLAAALVMVPEAVTASNWQSTDEIARVAEDFVKARYGKADRRVAPVAGHLDPRLRLPRCSQALEPFIRPGTKASSRTVVGVRCAGEKPWKVYVPVDVVVMDSVLVTQKTLPKGHVMRAEDVDIELQDVSRLTGGYLSDIGELTGQRLKHQIIGGSVITPAMLAAEILIRRGQSVTLVVRDEHLNITMAGKALSDGALNQRIRVENVMSQRVVEGLVRSPEYVEILVR